MNKKHKHIWKIVKTQYYDAVMSIIISKCSKCSKKKREIIVMYL